MKLTIVQRVRAVGSVCNACELAQHHFQKQLFDGVIISILACVSVGNETSNGPSNDERPSEPLPETRGPIRISDSLLCDRKQTGTIKRQLKVTCQAVFVRENQKKKICAHRLLHIFGRF